MSSDDEPPELEDSDAEYDVLDPPTARHQPAARRPPPPAARRAQWWIDDNDYEHGPRIVIGTLGAHALTYLIEIDHSSCVICMSDYNACDMVVVPPCKHVVHHLFMSQHLQANTSQQDPNPCPVCRATLFDVQPD